MDIDNKLKTEIKKEIEEDGLVGINVFAPFSNNSDTIKEDYLKMNEAERQGKVKVVNMSHG